MDLPGFFYVRSRMQVQFSLLENSLKVDDATTD